MHWLGITENNFTNLALLVVITNLSTLLPLPFLGWLPRSGDAATADVESALHPVPMIEADSCASKHLGQPFLPDLMTEFIPHSRQPEAIAED